MGQRLKLPPTASAGHFFDGDHTVVLSLSVFSTDLGWFGLLGREGITCGLKIGHISADEVRRSIASSFTDDGDEIDFDERDWNVALRRRLQRYAKGEIVDFRDVEIVLPKRTDFQQRIHEATRGIGYGETLSYAELAAQAGSPRAARAVGNTMASNRIPIIIPCHRVIASGQKIGGFSAPQGVDLKRRMLAIEAGNRELEF